MLERVERDGDLLAALDADVETSDRLTKYRSMRDSAKTPEPVPRSKPAVGQGNTFVIQEHHARRLHYDFRLERDGVLVSWAVPKNLPETTAVNHLAVHTEDHPLEYGGFEGTIPKGEYGGGKVIIWDAGTYDTEKFNDTGEKGEVIVTLHGHRISGRYALIQTDGNQWLAHRMKDQHVFDFDESGADAGDSRFGGEADRSAVGIRGQVGRLPTAGRRRPRRAAVAIAQRA